MLEAENLIQTIDFYTRLLGFQCVAVHPEPGNPVWVHLKKDETNIFFTIRNEHSGVENPTMTGSLYFYPDDIDKAWTQLKDKVTIAPH